MAFITQYRILLCILSALFPVTLGLGNHITLQEHNRIAEYLSKEVVKKYPTDQEDANSDTVTQVSKGKEVNYHHGDESQPVFLTSDSNTKGKKVIILKRGEDYIIPEDVHTFVVLRQKSGGSTYNLHLAIIYDIGRRKPSRNNSIVAWTNGRVEQHANITTALNLLGNRYLPKHRPLDKRPRCEWLASVLLCNANKDVPSPQRTFPTKLATMQPDPDKEIFGDATDGKNKGGEGTVREPEESSSGTVDSETEDSSGGGGSGSGGDGGSGDGKAGENEGRAGENDGESTTDGTGNDNVGSENKKGDSDGGTGKKKKDSEESPPEKSDADDDMSNVDGGEGKKDNKETKTGTDNSEERYIPIKGGDKSKQGGRSISKKKGTTGKKEKKKSSKNKGKAGSSFTLNKKHPKS